MTPYKFDWLIKMLIKTILLYFLLPSSRRLGPGKDFWCKEDVADAQFADNFQHDH